MANQVIVIDKRKYAVGLFWQPIAVGYIARNYARNLARGVDKKLNLYTEYRLMVGLGARRSGHKAGMPSAAAEVMEAFAEFSSFLAVFHEQGIYWLVAVRNGIIIADKTFDTEEDAREEYINLSAMPDWGSLFAPGAWNMPRSIERHLGDIVAGNVRAVLRPISNFQTSLISLILLSVFVLGVAYFFREPIGQMLSPKSQISEIDPALAEEYKKRIEQKNQELDKRFEIQKAPEQEVLEMPYDFLPDPTLRAQACYQAIGFLMQPIIGWDQTDVECGESHATVTFRRSFGNLADFYDIATALMPGSFIQERSESEVFLRAKLPTMAAVPSLDEKDPDTIVREINTLFQRIDLPVDTNVVIDTIANSNESVDLHVVEVGATTKLTPPEFMKIFDDFHGVYMTRATWTATSRTWNYEVIIYAK